MPSQCFECIFIANSEIEKVKWVESFNYTIKKCKRDYDEGKVVFCRRSICGTTVGTLKGAAEACPESEASQGHKHTSSKRFSLGRGIYSYIPLIGNKSKSMATMYLPGNCERQVSAIMHFYRS